MASVATIVFHVIRSELVHGAGLPLGFISSGFAFTQMRCDVSCIGVSLDMLMGSLG